MNDRIDPARPGSMSAAALDLLLVSLVFIAYAVTISIALPMTIGASLAAAAANTVPVVIFGALARQIIRSRLVRRSAMVQIGGHAALCTAFSLLSFWLLVVLLGLVNGLSPTEFMVKPFPASGTAWQMLETVTTYGMIAALSYLPPPTLRAATPIANVTALSTPAPTPAPIATVVERRGSGASRHFIRSGDELRPIDFDRIVSVAGADDYAEINSLDGTHLVRMTLAELEKTLDPKRFVRVHRSSIVNVDRIARAEPAGGGRLLLHMNDGQMISASRAGARLLRDRVI
jgi:hypothetical protein